MTNRFASARKFASNIVAANNLTPPIDPTTVIKGYGIEIIETENQLGIEAYSDLGEVPKITINTEYTFPARKRFTLAHELGHIIIPWHNGDVKCDTDTPYNHIGGKTLLDTQELEANIFASELLMPHDWLIAQIGNSKQTFQDTITDIQRVAQTSVMACLYALEDAFPSGKVFFVKKDTSDYWKKFASKRTCTTELYSKFNERINFLSKVCNQQERFHFSQYDIIYFELLPCPESSAIRQLYTNSEDIVECINVLSGNVPSKALPFLKDILSALDDIYSCFIFDKTIPIRSVKHPNAKISNYCSNLDSLLDTLEFNGLNYYILEDYPYTLVFVKECSFDFPLVEEVEPNTLLRTITDILYGENSIKMLQRINGIMSNASMRISDEKVIYTKVKSRFASDPDFVDFYNHSYFDIYVINKIRSIINGRKAKH